MFRDSILVLALFSLFFFSTMAKENKTFSAIFAFGDSVLDTGNNNFLLTLHKGNFWPHGWNFDYKIPTGRFGDGRVFSDIVAQGLGVKRLLPPYRKVRSLKTNDLKTGVCFASGGSGIDDLTSRTLRVLSKGDQVKNFKSYLKKLKGKVQDRRKVKEIIANAVFLISEGNNDVLYFAAPSILRSYSTNTYTNKMVVWTKEFLKDLYELGARKFAVLGVIPVGCTPFHRSAFGGWCNVFLNNMAKDFNTKLEKALQTYEVEDDFKGAKFVYVDMYGTLMDLINKPKAFGFTEAKRACCCMLGSIIPCRKPDLYVFFDVVHPTQKTYEVISKPLIHQMRKSLA